MYQVVRHETAAQMAEILRHSAPEDVARVHRFCIEPRIMRGLCAASFVLRDVEVHRFLTSYYYEPNLEEQTAPLENAIRWRRLPCVDGRVEIGANSGDLLRYFLPNAEGAGGPKGAEARRQDGFEAWLAAARNLDRGGPVLTLVDEGEWGTVVGASVGHDHCLIRLDGGGSRTWAGARKRLPRARTRKLSPDSALYRDIMGDWRT